jgi:UDP-N-acetyl-D-mannosaminuronate dehydrogenase
MTIGIIGLGYVGLPLAVSFAEAGQQGPRPGHQRHANRNLAARRVAHGLASTDLQRALEGADLAVIVTAHPGIDHAAIAASMPVVDLRGVTRPGRVARVATTAGGKES